MSNAYCNTCKSSKFALLIPYRDLSTGQDLQTVLICTDCLTLGRDTERVQRELLHDRQLYEARKAREADQDSLDEKISRLLEAFSLHANKYMARMMVERENQNAERSRNVCRDHEQQTERLVRRIADLSAIVEKLRQEHMSQRSSLNSIEAKHNQLQLECAKLKSTNLGAEAAACRDSKALIAADQENQRLRKQVTKLTSDIKQQKVDEKLKKVQLQDNLSSAKAEVKRYDCL